MKGTGNWLSRRVTRARWSSPDPNGKSLSSLVPILRLLSREGPRLKCRAEFFDVATLKADALTVDLKTAGDTLSLWLCNAESMSEIALALAAGSERLNKVEMVLLAPEEIAGFELDDTTPGATAISDLAGLHRDLVHLRARGVISIAALVAVLLRKCGKERFKSFSVKRVRTLLIQAVSAGRLDANDLHENLREVLAWPLKVVELEAAALEITRDWPPEHVLIDKSKGLFKVRLTTATAKGGKRDCVIVSVRPPRALTVRAINKAVGKEIADQLRERLGALLPEEPE